MTKSINELKNQFTAKEKLSKEHQVAIKGGDDKRNPPPPINRAPTLPLGIGGI